jgi:hypothetical protein
MTHQTVTEVLTAGTDSVNVINDINTNGRNSVRAGATTDPDGNVVASTLTQEEINDRVERNVNHLSIILLYDGTGYVPDVAGAASNLKTTHVAAVTTGTNYIAANPVEE